MALFKKILPSSVTRKKSKESLASRASPRSLSSGSSVSVSSSFDSNHSDIVDLFLMDTKYRDKRDGLNIHFTRHRRRDRKLSRLKHGLVEMENEVKELQRMITKTEAEIKAVERETKEKMEELENILKCVDKDTEVEVKKREPLIFKRYSNLKTGIECQNLLRIVRQKQRALQHIELLVYRKYIKFQHGGLIKSEKGRRLHSLLPVNKPARLKDGKIACADREQPCGLVFVEIEDRQPDDDVIDLTMEDEEDSPMRSSYDVPRETEV